MTHQYHGLIKENGRIKGYKSPESESDIREVKDHQERIKNDQSEMRRADHALEEWARWLRNEGGFNKANSITKIGETYSVFESRTPNDVEMRREVANVITVLHVMISAKSPGINMLIEYYIERNKKESIKAFCKRLYDEKQIFTINRIKKEFANRLGMLP